MNRRSFSLVLCCLVIASVACKKPNSASLSPFAQSLRSTCTTPFVGHGDSANIYLPTAFTPNGDGIDDYYGLTLGSYSFSAFSVKIYDTTGVLVYTSNNGTMGMWDGKDMNTGVLSKKYKFYVKINYTTTGNVTDSGGTYVFLLTGDATKRCVHVADADTAKYEFPDQFLPGTGFIPHSTSFETYCN